MNSRALEISEDALQRLKSHVMAHFRCESSSIHGPSHWERVLANGLEIAKSNGADCGLVSLFAYLHDSCRLLDFGDFDHGRRAAMLVKELQGVFFALDEPRLALLAEACAKHADGLTSEDPTLGACWDADRLDLGRVGIDPDPHFMSTERGRELAESCGKS